MSERTVAEGKFVAYYRVSTARQGLSGLGLEAQRKAVSDHLGGSRELVAEFTEVESGGKDDLERPELAKALAACRVYGATLVIAKLDRLARDAHFLLGLVKAGVKLVAADMPSANEMVVGIMAVVAQEERKLISGRTKAALAAAKARGVKLGGRPENLKNRDKGTARSTQVRQQRAAAKAADLLKVVEEIKAEGVTSWTGIARTLNQRGIPTPRAGGTWQAVQVQRLYARAA